MKKIAIAFGVLAVLVAAISYNIWNASQEPVTSTPGLFDIGKQKLHTQLEEARRLEADGEKRSWDSAPQLREMVKGHQQRIEKLAGNTQSAEIRAYDHESITRLEKRIADLAAREAAKAAEQVENKPAEN